MNGWDEWRLKAWIRFLARRPFAPTMRAEVNIADVFDCLIVLLVRC